MQFMPWMGMVTSAIKTLLAISTKSIFWKRFSHESMAEKSHWQKMPVIKAIMRIIILLRKKKRKHNWNLQQNLLQQSKRIANSDSECIKGVFNYVHRLHRGRL